MQSNNEQLGGHRYSIQYYFSNEKQNWMSCNIVQEFTLLLIFK
jgi:hypothetical protein